MSKDDVKRIPANEIRIGDELAVKTWLDGIHSYPATVGRLPGARYIPVTDVRLMPFTGSIGVTYGNSKTAFTRDRTVIVYRSESA